MTMTSTQRLCGTRQFLCSLLCLTATICGTQTHAQTLSPDLRSEYIVVLKPGARGEEVARQHGLAARHHYRHALNGFAGHIPEGRLRALQNDPRVELIEQDVEVYAFSQIVPTGIRRIGADVSPAAKIDGIDERVNADIAILDTGIDLTHPDLSVYRNVTFVSGTTTGNDDQGHGTHVAGIAAALDNGIGVVGVAPGARLWAVKVLDSTGSGVMSGLIQGVDYVTEHASEIEVANMSLGGYGIADSLRMAIQNSVAKGVVFVVAAGNSRFELFGEDYVLGGYDCFPAAYPEVMAVSALVDTDGQAGGTGASTTSGADDTLAIFSNFSVRLAPGNPVSSPGLMIDIAAPGVNIYSTYRGGSYATMNGTSMASPHVAGAAALYVSQYGRASDAAGVYAIRQALINAAEAQNTWGVNPPNPNPADVYAEGLIHVARIGGNPAPPTDTTPPACAMTSPSSGATVSGTITPTASALDNIAVSKVEFYIDGALRSTDTTSPYGFSWDTTSNVNGSHTIVAKAYDAAGNTATSASLSVKVQNSGSDSLPPTVVITSPAMGSHVSGNVKVSVSASDDVGVARVELYVDGSFYSSGTSATPVFSWSSGRAGKGTHTLTARAVDAAGNVGTSSPVTVYK